VAFASAVGAIGGDAADLLVHWDLTEKIGQPRRIADVAPGDLDSAELQCFLINPEMDLASDSPLRATTLAGAPFAFALDLGASAVDQLVQRPLWAPVGDVDNQGLLAARQRAEVGNRPVEANQPQQALNVPGRLPERHAEQHLHRQADLNDSIAVGLLAATPARQHAIPADNAVEPDHQRAPALKRFTMGRPVPDPVGRGSGSAHADQIPRWIHEMNA
jgi:hypothetical protein